MKRGGNEQGELIQDDEQAEIALLADAYGCGVGEGSIDIVKRCECVLGVCEVCLGVSWVGAYVDGGGLGGDEGDGFDVHGCSRFAKKNYNIL